MQKIRKGQRFGDWKLRKFLGQGGNGFVWLAVNSKSQEGAIKILGKMRGKRKQKSYSRFRDEVNIVRANQDIAGLLPIIDHFLPDTVEESPPWYVMPVAEPLDEYLVHKSFEVAVEAVLEIGRTLVLLHARGISHRDIKPPNLLQREGRFFPTDFGLVDYPDKADLTSMGEQIGAKWTIAPEMKRDSDKADGKPADVYSLGKTLWILITGRRYGFEGQYDPDSVNGLKTFGLTVPERNNLQWAHKPPALFTKPLDELLKDCTNDEISKRPTIDQFVERLSVWNETYKDFQRHNPLEWRDVQTSLFPSVTPQRAIWDDVDSIIEILNYLASVKDLTHVLLPDGGGLELLGAKPGLEPGTIELDLDVVYIVRPSRLLFESFAFTHEWNYFRLESAQLEPIGIGNVRRGVEKLIEISPLQYMSLDEGDYPPGSRYVDRLLRGDFVIFQKTSLYNRIPYTYDARHNQMSSDQFREYIREKVSLVQKALLIETLEALATEKGMTTDQLIFSYLDSIFRKEYLQVFSARDI